MVLEPLGVAADDLGAFRRFAVTVVDNALPGSLAAERIVVVLHETVYEIYVTLSVGHPCDVVFVPHPQVAGTVVLHEFVDILYGTER